MFYFSVEEDDAAGGKSACDEAGESGRPSCLHLRPVASFDADELLIQANGDVPLDC
jgi:hypothetical protein